MKIRFFGKGFGRRNVPPTAGEHIHSDRHYRVTFCEGRGDVVVLVFCGVGLQTNGIQVEEFRGSIGSSASVYYLADLQRSWWNNGRIEDVLETVFAHARARNAASVFTALGNSMGGSGAILASHLYPEIMRCLAFVPQADIRMTSPETRWSGYRKRISGHRWPDFALKPARAEQRIVFGALEDDWQRERFLAAGRDVVSFEGFGHNVAKELRDRQPDDYASLLRFALCSDRA